MTDTTTLSSMVDNVDLAGTMRAAIARRYGGVEQISLERVPVPTFKPNQVLVQVQTSSLNALDWHYLTGTPYFMRLMAGLRRPKRHIHGADVAGTVRAVGEQVTRFAVGDEVFGESGGGGFGQFLVVDEDHVVTKPSSVSFEAAGATPVAGLTAVQGLRTKAALAAGEHVLINGAAGGVGTFAVQIAKALGAEVTAVCSTRNVDMVKSLGADTVIDYVVDDFVDGGARFDVMLDNVGNRSSAECKQVLKPGGRYVAVSGPKDNKWLGPVPYTVRAALAFWRSDKSFHQFVASPDIDDLNFLAELLETHQVEPEIQRVVDLDGVVEALDEISTGHARAKIVVKPESTSV